MSHSWGDASPTGGTARYAYDPDGRPVQSRNTVSGRRTEFLSDTERRLATSAHGTTWTLTWDTLDRLTAIHGGFEARYVYDPLGRRIEKTEVHEILH